MFAAIIDGRTRSAKQEQEGRAWLAWTTAALYRSKKFPKLKDVMPKARKKDTGPQPWQQQLAIAKAWTQALSR